jgi:Tho complex subunit 7
MVDSLDVSSGSLLDQDILRQRLEQGVGAGNAARGSLSKCANKYREFLARYKTAEDADAIETAKQDLVRELHLFQIDMKKSALAVMAVQNDARTLDSDIMETELQIEAVQREIELARNELPGAKQTRRNIEEYEALAKMASTRPSRCSLERQVAQANSELKVMEELILKNKELKSMREKQFHLLMQSIFDLKESIKDEENEIETFVENEDERAEMDCT